MTGTNDCGAVVVLDDDIERLGRRSPGVGSCSAPTELARADQERVDNGSGAGRAVEGRRRCADGRAPPDRTDLAERVVAERTDIRRQREVLSTEAVELDAQAGQVREQTVQAQAEVAALEGELFSARTILDDLRARLNAWPDRWPSVSGLPQRSPNSPTCSTNSPGFGPNSTPSTPIGNAHSVDAEVAGAAQALAGRIDVARGRLEAASATHCASRRSVPIR